MNKHDIGQLNQAVPFTLDHNDKGHDLLLPDPGQNSTLTIYCLDEAQNQYQVAQVQLTKGQNTYFWLDPDKYPHSPWIQWELQPGQSTSAPAIPYSFYSRKHGYPTP